MSDLSRAAQRAGDAVADKVGTAANQAGGHANAVLNQIEDTIRQNPWLSVFTAAALGFTWARFRR